MHFLQLWVPGTDHVALRVGDAVCSPWLSVDAAEAQINKMYQSFVKRVTQEIWERDFGCAYLVDLQKCHDAFHRSVLCRRYRCPLRCAG